MIRKLVFALCATALVGVSVPGQTIAVDIPSADAGTVQRGTVITKEFVVKNTGSALLRIADVKPACGCTRAKFDKTIAPGGTGKIVLTIDTKSFRGPISKSAKVLSNDSATPEISLIVVASVRGIVRAEPSESLRIQAMQGHLGKAELLLTSEHADFKPTAITTTESYLHAVLNPAIEPGNWKVRVFSDSKAPAGPILGEVIVKTGITEEPEFRIPVSGVILSSNDSASGAEAGAQASAPADGDDADKPLSAEAIAKLTAGSSDDRSGDKEAGSAHNKNQQKALTNDDIIKLVKAELGDQVVIDKIKSSPGDKLDTSTDALIRLKKAGVSKAVIDAIITRGDE